MSPPRKPQQPGRFYAAPWEFADLTFVALFLLLILGLNLLIWSFPSIRKIDGVEYLALFVALGLEIGIPLAVLQGRRKPATARVPFRRWVGDLFSGCLTYVLLMPVLALVALVLSRFEEEKLADRLAIIRDENFVFQVAICMTAFTLVPICEEVFFRGLVYNSMRKRLSVGAALVTQAFLFGLLHPYSPTYPLYIFWVGLGLGLLYEWRKRLVAPILTHACFNSIGSLLILAATLLNQHQPAASWKEAEDVLSPPQWLVDQVMLLRREMGARDLTEGIPGLFGEDGLDTWKVEALCWVAFAEAVSSEGSAPARALLRAARLYLEHEDPYRAALLATSVQERFSDYEEMTRQASDLLSEALDRIRELPPSVAPGG